MIVVIQCASRKSPSAGHLTAEDGRKVMVVGSPEKVCGIQGVVYKRPDDPAYSGSSYRDVLVEYNRHPEENPLNLLPARELYLPPVYTNLVKKFGVPNVFILSAGWGLIAADFLTPNYDITFCSSAKPYKRRRSCDHDRDFSSLPNSSGPIVFLGGKDYRPLFCRLTEEVNAERIVFYRVDPSGRQTLTVPGCRPIPYETKGRTNWHYECAGGLIREKITIELAISGTMTHPTAIPRDKSGEPIHDLHSCDRSRYRSRELIEAVPPF